jgi:hypothetical protein
MVEQQQRVPLWWRQHPNGSYALFVRSGLKPIEFEKGKPAIAVSSLDKLPSVMGFRCAHTSNDTPTTQWTFVTFCLPFRMARNQHSTSCVG